MALTLLYVLSLCIFSTRQQNDFGKLEIVSDLSPEDCFDNGLNYQQDSTNGLPSCVADFTTKQLCNKYLNPTNKVVYKPTNCAKDGTFGPVQCKGERTTGRCFCFDAKGNRLFGQQWWSQADTMTCACSRRKADLVDSVIYNSLHCNSMGNYEELQCDVISEQCWCADEQTGDLTSSVVPSAAMSKLPCYSSADVGSQYLRQCENKKYAQKMIEHQLILRGTTAAFGDFLCDDDGSFGAYVISDGSAYCTWRDNSKIGAYQPGSNTTGVNCYCARDTKIFSSVGKSQTLTCEASGNYKAYQESGSTKYCVDQDGYRKSPSGVTVTELTCAQYKSFDGL